jgi:hypothetical protein
LQLGPTIKTKLASVVCENNTREFGLHHVLRLDFKNGSLTIESLNEHIHLPNFDELAMQKELDGRKRVWNQVTTRAQKRLNELFRGRNRECAPKRLCSLTVSIIPFTYLILSWNNREGSGITSFGHCV